jgi:hypothetical protein
MAHIVLENAAINIAVQFKIKVLQATWNDVQSNLVQFLFLCTQAFLLFSLKCMKSCSYWAVDSHFYLFSLIIYYCLNLIVKYIASFVFRYHYNVADSRLHQHIEKGNQDGLYISSVASSANFWALIMDAGTGFCSQVYELSHVFLHKVHYHLFVCLSFHPSFPPSTHFLIPLVYVCRSGLWSSGRRIITLQQ